MPWFLELGTGASWSMKTFIDTQPQYNRWNLATTEYHSTLGTVPIYMAGLGYTVSPLLKIDASYSFRGLYKYRTHLNTVISNVQNQLPHHSRYFDLTSNSLMFSGTLYAQGLSSSYPNLAAKLIKTIDGYGYIQPIIGGGMGVSYNTVSNFHTILDTTYTNTSAMQDQTIASFAWQLNAGLDWQITDRFSFDMGYRYFNAGRFNSADALITRVSGTTNLPITTNWVPSWIGTLSANEMYFIGKVTF